MLAVAGVAASDGTASVDVTSLFCGVLCSFGW
jgi:hypothetical protein